MSCKVVNERWVGRHLLCDVVLEDLAILGVTACGSVYGESVKTWFNAAIPQDVRNEIEKAVLIVDHRGSSPHSAGLELRRVDAKRGGGHPT